MSDTLQYERTSQDATTDIFKVTLPAAEFTSRYHERVRTVAREAVIPGFRQGKVPVSLVQARYGESVAEEIAQDLIRDAYRRLITESNVRAIAVADIEDIVFGVDQEFTFTAIVPVEPEFEATGFEKIAATKYVVDISEADVDSALQELRAHYATYPVVDRAALESDFIGCEVTALDADGETVQGTTRSIPSMPIANDPLGAGSTALLVGATVGETRIVKTVHEEAHDEHTHSHEHNYRVKIEHVKERILPEITDEFAEQLTGVADKAKLSEVMQAEMTRRVTQEVQDLFTRQIRVAVLAANEFPIPEKLVERYIERIHEQTERESGNKFSREAVEQYFRPVAVEEAKFELLLNNIGRKLEITISDEEVEKFVRRVERDKSTPFAKLKADYDEGGRWEAVRMELMRTQAYQRITESAVVEEKPVGYGEFRQLKDR